MDQLDREVEQIENDETMTQKEKNEAIREAEMAAGDWERQREAEHQEIDRRYGY